MAESYTLFQNLHINHLLNFKNRYMSKLIDHFLFLQVNDDDQLNIDLANKLQASQVIIMDNYEHSSLNYFIICFNENLILISDSSINKMRPLICSNKKSTIYSFSSEIKSLFLCDNKILNNLNYIEQDINFKNEIKSFSSQFKIANKEIQEFWKILSRIISAYLIKKSYIDSFFDRIKNYKEMMISNPEEKIIKMDEIIILRNIDTGNISKIELIYYIPQRKLLIIKKISEEYHYLFSREQKNYLQCNHPFMPRYYGTIEYNSENYLVIEYIQGISLNYIQNIQLEMYEKIKIVFELLIIFQYIHSKNFIYRDLKPNNLIIDKNKNIVLIDFDRMITNSSENTGFDSTHDFTNFAAPEFSSNLENYSYEVDIYSIGKIIEFIFFKNQIQLEYKEEYAVLKEIYEICTNVEPQKRPNISELIDLFFDKLCPYLFKQIPDNHLLYNELSIIIANSYQKSLNNYGMFHLYWMKSDLSHQKGIYYINMAAELNCCEAQYNLGIIYYEAKFIQRNVNKAIKYFSLAANQNLSIAQFVLAMLYNDGKYIERDINKAVYYMKQALKNNYIDALNTIGSLYFNENDMIKCFDKDIKYTRIASGRFDMVICEEGMFKSIKYFKQAADQNDALSQFILGNLYYNNNIIPHDIRQAIHYYTLAANQNHIGSEFYLGEIYHNGKYVQKDIQKVIYYFSLAANNDLINSYKSIEIIKNNGNLILKMINNKDYISDIKFKAKAQYELGMIYIDGKDVEKNTNKGINFLQQASSNNYAMAQYRLGMLYYEGIQVPKDISKAMYFLLLAANQNIADSEFTLGYIFYEGVDVKQDINKAIYYMYRAACKNYHYAQLFLANIYLSGNFGLKDDKKAFYYLTKAVEQNCAEAQNLLGELYLMGRLVQKDIDKAIYYIKLAANQNFIQAQYNLGKIYFDGLYVCKDIDQAIKYFTLAAKKNDAKSQFYLGIIFNQDLYVQRNVDKAIYYLTLAANQNLSDAQFVLGYIYLYEIVPKNTAKTIYYYTLAAKNNNDHALHCLGSMYLNGEEVPQDINKGIEYLTRAANNDFQISQRSLGYYYYFGKYISKNIKKGIQYFFKSAKGFQGKEISFLLGNIYLKGKYLPRDVDKAIHYYKESSCYNDQYAKNNLGIIYKNGFGQPKRITYSIEYFKEAIQQKNDPISMYNLAHIYFYNEDLKIDFQTIIDLLVNSYYNNFTKSKNLLFLVLFKKHNYLSPQIIEDEINPIRKDRKKLVRELSQCIIIYSDYSKLYNFIKNIDFIYNDYLEPIELIQFLYNKIEKEESKGLKKEFYEGFGINI